jgi:hypothetical protein
MRTYQKVKDRAYAAGVLDSDGCIGLVRNRRRWIPNVRVTNLSLPLLYWFKERWRGSVLQNKGARGVPEWAQRGPHLIQAFLEDVRPYLIVKAKQADILLAYFASTTDYRGKSVDRPDGRRPLEEDALRERFQLALRLAKSGFSTTGRGLGT